MSLRPLHDIEQGNEDRHERQKDFPGPGIIFAVGVFVFPVRPDLGGNEYDNEENNESNLAGGEFHSDDKGNARGVIPYF